MRNYAYIKRGWINRNRILYRGTPEFLGIAINKASSFSLIIGLHIADTNKFRKMNKFYEAYHKAPYYVDDVQLMEEIPDCKETSVENIKPIMIAYTSRQMIERMEVLSMILAGNQPYFLPYITYWQLINVADVFYVGDNYTYIRHGWINRNRILCREAPVYFGMAVNKASSFSLINELYIADTDKLRKMNKLYEAYHNAPYYKNGVQLMEEILDCKEEVLSEFLISSIKTICRYLDINTPIHRTSELKGNDAFKREGRIYDMCHRLGADMYVNPIGGKALYDVDEFAKQGIKLRFINTGDITYRQFGGKFVEKLSILDVIMFNSKDEIKEMLGRYELIT
ncbi:MAG: WbqC family protein [Lachnospiraceae bacterium]|nr:WbqC family protein [Lachnospiraceae bacterium]MBR6152394.1 WbqC family protein [Lachnospiraceae bacterium]